MLEEADWRPQTVAVGSIFAVIHCKNGKASCAGYLRNSLTTGQQNSTF
jgi:hypothetical protein